MTLTEIIAAHIEHPDHKRLANDPATSLREVRIQHVTLIGLAQDIEDAMRIEYPNFELSDEAIHAWHSVGCIQRTIRALAMDERIAGDGELV